MNYFFSGYKLDSQKQQLYFDSALITLTKQNYQLLLYFVKNSNKVITKDELIKNVWQGKIVADNSIDQSIYKLKNILVKNNDINYFETVYGLGIKFNVEVAMNAAKNKNNLSKKFILSIILLGFIVFAYWQYFSHVDNLTTDEKSLFMIIPITESNSKDNWYNKSTNLAVKKLLSLSNAVTLLNYKDKPTNLNQQQYLETQWKLSPQMQTLSSLVSFERDVFSVQLTIKNKHGEVKQQTFKSDKLKKAFVQSLDWLNQYTKVNKLSKFTAELLPKNPYLLELYMRGLSAVANHNPAEAINYFELCLNENPRHHLANIELIKLKDKQGETKEALALLNTVSQINTVPEIEIEIMNLKGGILLRQGKPKEAQQIYNNLLDKYSFENHQSLLTTKFQLSIVYRTLSQNQLSLQMLSEIESVLIESQAFTTLANVYQAKGSLLLRIGQTDKASFYVSKATKLYVELGDLLGQAKSHSVTARIAIQQAQYDVAIIHLKQALNITQGLGHKFGIGATLNEIITVLIAQGKINQAWELNQRLESIAIEIDFTAMLLASKRYRTILSEHKKQWQTAAIYLNEHLELAKASNNKRAIIENRFLAISLNISQDKIANSKQLIAELSDYIIQSEELRLEPQLNILKAQIYLLNNQTIKAENLLSSSKILATTTNDVQSLIQINNILAEIYINENKPEKALLILQESKHQHPFAKPYLMLQSKAHLQLKHIEKALEIANLCKIEANDLWTNADDKYLHKLIKKYNNSEVY